MNYVKYMCRAYIACVIINCHIMVGYKVFCGGNAPYWILIGTGVVFSFAYPYKSKQDAQSTPD